MTELSERSGAPSAVMGVLPGLLSIMSNGPRDIEM